MPLSTQRALRLLLLERIVIEAKLTAFDERLSSTPQLIGAPEPPALSLLKVALRDSDKKLRAMAGGAYPQIISTLGDPEIVSAMRLAVPREEDAGPSSIAKDVWRKQQLAGVASPIALSSKFRYASHDSPTARGHKDLHNILHADPHGLAKLSFFEKVAHTYGVASVGDTCITSVWGQVYSPLGAMRPHAPPVPTAAAAQHLSDQTTNAFA